MTYKDVLGTDIKVGDSIVYSSSMGGFQIGKVKELTTKARSDYSKPLPRKYMTCEQVKCWYVANATKGVTCPTPNRHQVGRTKYAQVAIPALRVQGARKRMGKFEKLNESLVTHFDQVMVINSNLVVTLTLL